MISFGNAASSHGGLILLKTANKFMQIYFFWLVVQVHKLWNLKTMPFNNEDAHYCKHKIWWENWLYLRPYLKAFLVFNVLETCRVFVSHGFLKNAKFVGMDQITFKNCNKSSWIQVSKILLTRNRPEQFPSFFFFQWNQTTIRWCCISKAYHFLKMLPNCVDSIQFHYFYDSFKKNFVLKYFENGP